MSQNKNNLSAFVRYDGSGRVIPGSNILQKNKPKVGDWKQTQAYQCCDPSCAIPVYSTDFIVPDVVSSSEGLTFLFDTAPDVTIQVQLYSCELNRQSGTIYTIPPLAVNFEAFFTTAEINGACNLGVRRVCGPSYFSNWLYES